MKKCSYCGKEYPDEVVICPADQTSLDGSLEARKKVTGVWRGVYGYGPRMAKAGYAPVAFTLKLKQGWFADFYGSMADEQPKGIPGTGSVEGYFNSPKIEFTQPMPVGYFIAPDGSQTTFREYLVKEGITCEHDLPAPPILYQGTFLDGNRVQGIWTIVPEQAKALQKWGLPLRRLSGYWCAKFVSLDLEAAVDGAPDGPLFDKSLLSQRELAEVEDPRMVSLGKFNTADFQVIIERILRANIGYATTRYDLVPGQELMEEIFVSPRDLEEAKALLLVDDQV